MMIQWHVWFGCSVYGYGALPSGKFMHALAHACDQHEIRFIGNDIIGVEIYYSDDRNSN